MTPWMLSIALSNSSLCHALTTSVSIQNLYQRTGMRGMISLFVCLLLFLSVASTPFVTS